MIENYNELIDVINHIYLKHENDINEVEFNLFELFALRNSEVLHSIFIAELLNPHGKHKQGDIFLKLFLETINFNDFSISNITVNTELFVGYIDEKYNEGGRIDICVQNNKKQAIVIENKIYACDQYKQLIRYWQFSEKNCSSYKLYYLSLFGHKPTNDSYIDENINLSNIIHCISYQKDILRWINKCIHETANNSVREVLKQYLNTIEKLTNQTTNDKMKEEVKLKLTENLNYFNAFEQIRNITDEIRSELAQQIVFHLNSKIEPFEFNSEIKIQPQVINDGDGFQLAFWAHDKNGNDISKNEVCNVYFDKMRAIGRISNPYQFSGSPICWINFNEFYKKKMLENMSGELVCALYNTKNENILRNREEFYNKLEIEIDDYTNQFIKTCKI